jgi:outer membrane protein assembly factor BamB
MSGHSRTIVSLAVSSLFIFGGVLTATASRTATDKAAAPANAWSPKSADWPTFHDNNARTGLTAATATMKIAYYKWTVKTGGRVMSSPAVATVNSTINGTINSDTKIFVGSNDNRLYCIDGLTGTVIWRYQANGAITSSPAVGDLSGDGNPKVVFGCEDNRIYCLYCSNGTLAWRYTTRSFVEASPVFADLNGDGMLEVAIGSFDGVFYMLDHDGKVVWKATLPQNGHGILSAAAVRDINGDNKPEIVIQSDEHNVTCLAGADGKELWNNTGLYNPKTFSFNSPVIADLDGNGKNEVLALGGPNNVYCLYGGNGTFEWNKSLSGFMVDDLSTPAVGDGNGDGKPEIYINNYNSILCIDGGDGFMEWSRNFVVPQHTNGYGLISSPALADIDGDGKLEVIFASCDRAMHALNAEDGSIRWAYPCPMLVGSSPAVADIDGDGKAEVVFGCNDARVYALDYNF